MPRKEIVYIKHNFGIPEEKEMIIKRFLKCSTKIKREKYLEMISQWCARHLPMLQHTLLGLFNK